MASELYSLIYKIITEIKALKNKLVNLNTYWSAYTFSDSRTSYNCTATATSGYPTGTTHNVWVRGSLMSVAYSYSVNISSLS